MAGNRSTGGPGLLFWLGLALVVILADQVTKTLIVGQFALGDVRRGDRLLQPRARAQRGRGVLLPQRRLGLAALVLRGRGPAGLRHHRLDDPQQPERRSSSASVSA
jgi:hypothetical protein